MSRVNLLNIPLENDYKHTLYFANKTAQHSYFEGQAKRGFDDFTYQRQDSKMRLPIPYEEAIKYNYVMYTNDSFPSPFSKWFYAFITDYEYKGEDQTNITIETDVIQTWLFDYNVKPSFVDREHCLNDSVGLHTVPENLEIGDYICSGKSKVAQLTKTHIVLGTTVDSTGKDVQGGNYNGIYSGLKYYSDESNENGVGLINAMLKVLAGEGKIDAVQCIFVAPEFLTKDDDETLGVAHSDTPKSMYYTVPDPVPYYTPRNNKLMCFPYRYLLASNNAGGTAIYKYERFSDGLLFIIQGALTPGCSIRMFPNSYNITETNDVYDNIEEGLNLGKFPICNWNSDVYTNWLTQNSVNIGLNMALGVGQIVAGAGIALGSGGLATAVGGSSIVGGATQIASQLTQIHQMSFTPPQSNGNINCGDVVTSCGDNTFHFYHMTVKNEYLRIIDDYFTMFGYKCNRVKIPEKDHRENWWYTKTIDVNININDGSGITTRDLQMIKNCYNNGITFWKSDIGNYDRTNKTTVVG